MANNLLKVLVVDDTTTYRMIVRRSAESIAGVEVVDFAANGRIALDKLGRMAVDVVLLDVEMPEMDGLTTLQHITKLYPHIAVVMVSGASHANANIVVECLNSGAFDFVTKPLESDIDQSKEALVASLKPILSVLAKRGKRLATKTHKTASAPRREAARLSESPPTWKSISVVGQPPDSPPTAPTRATPTSRNKDQPTTHRRTGQDRVSRVVWNKKPALLLIGASTGGPAALTQVLSNIQPALSIPALIVQHMPPMFTTSLAAQLSRSTSHSVREAEHNQEIKAGKILLAPGGRHLSVKKLGGVLRTVLHDGPKVNGCRPSVDVLFLSVMASFSEPILAIILTGMGTDGANGVKGLKQLHKSYCITQSRDSCVVYGMPRTVVEMGLSDASVSLVQMGTIISELCR